MTKYILYDHYVFYCFDTEDEESKVKLLDVNIDGLTREFFDRWMGNYYLTITPQYLLKIIDKYGYSLTGGWANADELDKLLAQLRKAIIEHCL